MTRQLSMVGPGPPLLNRRFELAYRREGGLQAQTGRKREEARLLVHC